MTVAAVWGASGFAGSSICAAASALGWTARRLQRSHSSEAVRLELEASEERMMEALDGADIAFHCAGKLESQSHAGYADSTERFARACLRVNVRRMVYLSTTSVYGTPRAGELGAHSPVSGRGAYALSRIDAESRIANVFESCPFRSVIVRVPMLIGPGMPGTLLKRFFGVLRSGVFPHPGRIEAFVAALGVTRISSILVRLPERVSPVIQFADHLRWVDLANRYGELCGRRIHRIRVPNPGGRFEIFDCFRHYADDTSNYFDKAIGLPSTQEDVDKFILTEVRYGAAER